MIAPNDKVPNFKFTATGHNNATLSDFLGHAVVLYFYPKDDTPGCTLEAQGFRDKMAEFKQHNAIIFGVSKDNLKSHGKFKEKYCMPFELISDEDESICKLFDVIREKSMYGKKYMGIERSTFLIDAQGVLRYEWRKVSVTGHVDAVLNQVKTL